MAIVVEEDLFDSTSSDRFSSPPSVPTRTAAEAAMNPFPLLSFPPEVVHNIIACLLQPPPSSHSEFPLGVDEDCFALSLTSRLLNNLCRPFIWRSIRYEPVDYHSGVASKAFRKRRGLGRFLEILQEANKAGRSIAIKLLSFCTHTDLYENATAYQAEMKILIEIVSLMSGSLEVLFLEGVEMIAKRESDGARLMGVVAESKALSAIRFNQCDLGSLASLEELGIFGSLRTVQIMHGSRRLVRTSSHSG